MKRILVFAVLKILELAMLVGSLCVLWGLGKVISLVLGLETTHWLGTIGIGFVGAAVIIMVIVVLFALADGVKSLIVDNWKRAGEIVKKYWGDSNG